MQERQGKPEHDVRNNIEFQHQFAAQVQELLRRHSYHFVTFRLASKWEDTRQATDMVMVASGDVSIAVRIRRPRRGKQYRDLTLRAMTRGGGTTELEKIRQGWGDWYFYGWCDHRDTITEWVLVNLDMMRESGLLDEQRRIIHNGDGTGFVVYDLGEVRNANALQCGVVSINGYTYDMQRVIQPPPLPLPKHLQIPTPARARLTPQQPSAW